MGKGFTGPVVQWSFYWDNNEDLRLWTFVIIYSEYNELTEGMKWSKES